MTHTEELRKRLAELSLERARESDEDSYYNQITWDTILGGIQSEIEEEEEEDKEQE